MKHSETLGALAAALAAAQAEMPRITKGHENSFFKSNYADLADVTATISPTLSKHGLAVTQLPGGFSDHQVLTTILMHTSGEFVASDMPMMPVKADPQSQGSALTYARRYALLAICGVHPAGEDDDGNTATQNAPRPAPPVPVTRKNEWRPDREQPVEVNPVDESSKRAEWPLEPGKQRPRREGDTVIEWAEWERRYPKEAALKKRQKAEEAAAKAETPVDDGLITTRQINFLRKMLRDQEITDEVDVLLVVGSYIARTINDLKTLTKQEATVAIDKAKEASK